mgnify:CR=1 FL=1
MVRALRLLVSGSLLLPALALADEVRIDPHADLLYRQALRLADDPVRLGQQMNCAFAPATLAAISDASEHAPARLEQFFFGLVVTQADQQKTIPAFTPQREQFLDEVRHRDHGRPAHVQRRGHARRSEPGRRRHGSG